MNEPTFQSLHGAITALPPARPDRVVRLVFHDAETVQRVIGPRWSTTSSAAALLGLPVDLDPDVPEGVFRQIRADGTHRDLPL